MKRFHIHVGVKSIEDSIPFYSTLFGKSPTKIKKDYAKWMLDDPKINFAISTRSKSLGVDHLGIQVDEAAALTQLTDNFKKADLGVYNQGTTTCCYAKSEKAWVKDPAGIAWETYHSMSDAETYHDSTSNDSSSPSSCCTPATESQNNPPAKKHCC